MCLSQKCAGGAQGGHILTWLASACRRSSSVIEITGRDHGGLPYSKCTRRCGDPPNHQIYLIALMHGEVSLNIHTIRLGQDYTWFGTIQHFDDVFARSWLKISTSAFEIQYKGAHNMLLILKCKSCSIYKQETGLSQGRCLLQERQLHCIIRWIFITEVPPQPWKNAIGEERRCLSMILYSSSLVLW